MGALVQNQAPSMPLDVAEGLAVVGAVDLEALNPGVTNREAHRVTVRAGLGKGRVDCLLHGG